MADSLRVLVVGHAYIGRENRRKLAAMGRRAVIRVLVPESGAVDVAGPQRVRASDSEGYGLIPLSTAGSVERGTRWYFTTCREAWKGFRPDVVHIEQEVWALSRLQALVNRRQYAPGAASTLFCWENLRRPGWRGSVAGLFYRLAVRTTDVITVGNREGREIFLRYGADPSRVLVMPQVGLDGRRLAPLDESSRPRLRRELGVPEAGLLVGYAGRLVREKGVLDLVEAARGLAQGGMPVHVVMRGSGPLEMALRDGPMREGLLTLLPPAAREAMAPFYQALDVFVLPSRTTPGWKEQFGMVAAEAMACGLPVVGSDSGAIPDVIGTTGLVFPEENARALADTLARLADNALRARLGSAARARALRFYTHEAVAAQTLAAFDRALGRGRGGFAPAYCEDLH